LIFLRGGRESLSLWQSLDTGTGVKLLSAEDFDGDGLTDLCSVKKTTGTLIYFRGGNDALELFQTIELGGKPQRLASGDLNGDGFLDLLITENTVAHGAMVLLGRPEGFLRTRDLPVALPIDLALEDATGDGFDDAIFLTQGGVTCFRQKVSVSHAGAVLGPGASPEPLLDPRSPGRYRLEVPVEALPVRTTVACAPALALEIPQGERLEASGRGRCLIFVTDAIGILREETTLEAPASLTLRVREALADQVLASPGRLRLFRRDVLSGLAADEGVPPERFTIADFERSKGVSFPISRFGTYAVALEVPR
jgi:hypothetical protein